MPPAAARCNVVRPALRFALDVPAGWTVRDLGGDVVLECLAPAAQGGPAGAEAPAPEGSGGEGGSSGRRAFRAVIQVTAIGRDGITALGDWADAAIREAGDVQSSLEVVSRADAKLADGRAALLVVLEDRRGVEVMRQRMFLVMTDRFAYALVATGPERRLAALDAEITKCFDSLVVW